VRQKLLTNAPSKAGNASRKIREYSSLSPEETGIAFAGDGIGWYLTPL